MIFFLNFLVANCAVLFLPGYLFNLLIFKDRERDILEIFPYSFGSSLALLLPICILSFVLHLNIHASFFLMTALIILLLALLYFKFKKSSYPLSISSKAGPQILDKSLERSKKQQNVKKIFSIKLTDFASHLFKNINIIPEKKHLIIAVPALLLLAVVLLTAYRIESYVYPAVEDTNVLSMARKIYGLSGMHFDRILYKEKLFYPYLLPLYSYILAMLSYVSGLEILQIYIKMRFVFTLLTFITAYSLACALFPKIKELPWLVILVSSLAVVGGMGKAFSGSYGQFLAFGHYQDFALCVVLPICFMFFIEGLKNKLAYIMLSSFIGLTLFFIHAREAIIFAMLVSAVSAGLFMVNKDRKILLRGAIVFLVMIFAGLILGYLQSVTQPPDLIRYNKEMAGLVSSKLFSLLNGPSVVGLFYPPLENESQFFSGYNFFYSHPYYMFAFSSIPILLLFRKNFGLSVIGFSLLTPFLIMPIPLFSLLLIKVTYDQMLWHGPALFGIFQLCYIVLSLFIISVINLFGKYDILKIFYVPAIILFLLFLAIIVHLPQWLYFYNNLLFYIWIFSGILIVVKFKGLNYQFDESLINIRKPSLIFVVIGCFIFFLAHGHGDILKKFIPDFPMHKASARMRFTPVWIDLKEALGKPPVTEWERWYSQSEFGMIPIDAVSFIRENIPNGKLFAAPYGGASVALQLSVMTDQFIYSTQTYTTQVENDILNKVYKAHYGKSPSEIIDTPHRLDEYLKQRYNAIMDYDKVLKKYFALMYIYDETMKEFQPIFNQVDAPDTTLNLIKEFNIDYILVTPKWHSHLDRLSYELKGAIEKVYDKNQVAIYKVKRTD